MMQKFKSAGMVALRAVVVVIFMITMSVPGWAWHKDRPPGAVNQPEISEQQLQQQQSMQAVQGEVGVVPEKSEDTPVIEGTDAAGDKPEVVASKVTGSDKGAQILGTATKEIEGPQARNPWETLSIVILLIAAAFWFVRRWASQNIPPMTMQS